MEKHRKSSMELEKLEIEPLSDGLLDLMGGADVSPWCCSLEWCSSEPWEPEPELPAPTDIWASET